MSDQPARSETKYGDRLADHDWSDPEPETAALERTSVTGHEIEVIHTTDPDATDGYGRKKYSATVSYDDETGEPHILYVVAHRWKGNYWRDVTDLDWRDAPEPVRRQVAAVLPVDGPSDLDSGTRLIDEGGESRWEKHHMPRVDAMDSGEMWAQSSLGDATRSLERAAENLRDADARDRAEGLVDAVRELHQDLEPEVDDAD